MLTGLGLFLPSWRSGLGPLLPVDQAIHEVGGILYGIALVAVSARFFPWPSRAQPFVYWAYFFLAGLAITGAGLLVGPSWTRSIATVGHAAFAATFVLWTGWHLVTRLPVTIRRRHPAPSPDSPPVPALMLRRRRFLRWSVATVFTLPLLGALPTMMKLVVGRIAPASGAENLDALPGFVPYTVVNGYPQITTAAWHLTVSRQGKSVKTWTFAEWNALPKIQRLVNFQCVTGWAVDGVRFAGVDLEAFLRLHQWDAQTEPWILFRSGDGVYTDSLSATQITRYHPMLVSTIDQKPLPISQGHPVRLYVPNMYGYKSVKWLVGIEFARKDQLGYWEVRGYPQNAYYGSYQPLEL